jgi:hypothetical protein
MTLSSDDCIQDAVPAKDAFCIKDQPGRAVYILLRDSEAIRTGNLYALPSEGIVTASLNPYRLRPAPVLAPGQRPCLRDLHQISYTAALSMKGVGRDSCRRLAFSNHPAHRNQIDGREPAMNNREQLKSGHSRHVKVGKQNVGDLLTNLNQCRKSVYCTPSAVSEITENLGKRRSKRFHVFNYQDRSFIGFDISLQSTQSLGRVGIFHSMIAEISL